MGLGFLCLNDICNFLSGVGMLCFNRRFGCLDKKSIIDIKLLEDMFDAIDKDLRSIVFKPYIYVSTPLYRQFKKAADHLFRLDFTCLITHWDSEQL